jgi:hypothetical protein
MVKRIFYFSLILVFGIAITFVACSDENNVKNEQNDLNSDLLSARQKGFDRTLAKIKEMYPENAQVETRSNQVNVSSLMTCGPESDPSVNCANVPTIPITLPVAGTGTVYHPSLPPMDCGFNIRMNVKFCQSSNPNQINSVVIFQDFQLLGFINPVSQACFAWLQAWSNLTNDERNQVFRDLQADYQSAFEMQFMELWASDPNNNFADCDDPCSGQYNAIHAKYYQASCSKICLVFERECEDPWFFLCRKEIPCYSDGCCKKETTYCLNTTTHEVEVCHQAYYLQGECRTPVENAPCVVELESCTTDPKCPKKG